MNEKIKFAIIGYGGIGKIHARAAYEADFLPESKNLLSLVAIVTRKENQELDFPAIEKSSSLHEVLGNSEIKFVSLCTPNENHYEVGTQILKAGKGLYCEKPIGKSYEETLALTRLACELGLPHGVPLVFRYLPAVQEIKKLLSEKLIGDIIHFRTQLYHKSYLSEAKKGTWRTLENSGGGALLDLGVHLADLVHFIFGPVHSLQAQTGIFFQDRSFVDETANVSLKQVNGVSGEIAVSRIYAESEDAMELTVYGTKGHLKISSSLPFLITHYDLTENQTSVRKVVDQQDCLYYPKEKEASSSILNGHRAALCDFAAFVGGQKSWPLRPTFLDGLAAEKLIHIAYKSAAKNSEFTVNYDDLPVNPREK